MVEQRVAIFGATGSIGASTLAVIHRHPERFAVVALTAHRQWEALLPLCETFRPRWAAVVDPEGARALEAALRARALPVEVLAGEEALVAIAASPEVDTVVAGVVGGAGLPSTYAAVAHGKRVLLANKEALVMTGALLTETAERTGAVLLPIDSEHNALFQCLASLVVRTPDGRWRLEAAEQAVRRLILTASGGPFRTRDPETFATVTPEEACAHPTWSMGRKISVDSATMMNKGLEVIEAFWLFGLPLERIEVLLHPQSVVHALVEYRDGTVLAQLSEPDMRVPIAHALAWPERIASGASWLSLAERGTLTFEAPDFRRFPCLQLAFDAARTGGSAPTVLNAANEEAVAAFLARTLTFDRIPAVVAETLAALPATPIASVESALEIDRAARIKARQYVQQWSR
ncbi:1-deoxy-D-xylulose-5-phosphate reductoisomerase [Hydrogenophilus islandicus]